MHYMFLSFIIVTFIHKFTLNLHQEENKVCIKRYGYQDILKGKQRVFQQNIRSSTFC